jgi:23S rRNA pseudouridine1911/1915/1917 synthase
MTQEHELWTSAADAGRRFDVVLADLLDRSRSACALLIREGRATLDGRVVKPSHVLAGKSRILVAVPPPRDLSVAPQALPIAVVYDDDDLCVVDKPAGMATHPARGTPDGTLVNALLDRFPALPAINGVRRPGIVHRLDKDTSGLLVVAKSERAMTVLTRAMAQRRIKRSYDAVVWGIPQNPRGAIDAPIGRDPHARTKFTVREDGRRAVTHYRVIETFERVAQTSRDAPGSAALLRLELETGRTHQIRVHTSAIGHPIIGDDTYGLALPGIGMRRQALHAAELAFAHPVTGKTLRFKAAWPDDFRALVERLRAGDRP